MNEDVYYCIRAILEKTKSHVRNPFGSIRYAHSRERYREIHVKFPRMLSRFYVQRKKKSAQTIIYQLGKRVRSRSPAPEVHTSIDSVGKHWRVFYRWHRTARQSSRFLCARARPRGESSKSFACGSLHNNKPSRRNGDAHGGGEDCAFAYRAAVAIIVKPIDREYLHSFR